MKENFAVLKIIRNFVADKSCSLVDRANRNIDGMKILASCKAELRKGVTERYHSVTSNFATLTRTQR